MSSLLFRALLVPILGLYLSSAFRLNINSALTVRIQARYTSESSRPSFAVQDAKTYRSPCKINLFLKILRKRPDGYHDLASLFQTVSLSDYLKIEKLGPKSTADELTCSDTSLVVNDKNLVIKALNLMRAKTNIQQYFKVRLDKNVPMQAGLGGGSGNAATAMFAFKQLTGCTTITESQLQEWAGEIGSDISFFFSSGTAYCEKKGEVVTSLPPLIDAKEVIVDIIKPPEGLSTPLVFKNMKFDACSQQKPEDILALYTSQGALKGAVQGGLINDLEAPSFLLAPRLEEIKEALRCCSASVAGSMMSGSGTSVYSLSSPRQQSDQQEQQEGIARVLKNFTDVQHFRVEFLNRQANSEQWY